MIVLVFALTAYATITVGLEISAKPFTLFEMIMIFIIASGNALRTRTY